MDDVYVYCIPLPEGINELVSPGADGFTVYISDRLDRDHRIKAYRHALRHIKDGDFDKTSAELVELHAHRCNYGNSKETR